MRYALWIVQILLAVAFLLTGGTKLLLPTEALTEQIPVPALFSRFIGVAEVLAAFAESGGERPGNCVGTNCGNLRGAKVTRRQAELTRPPGRGKLVRGENEMKLRIVGLGLAAVGAITVTSAAPGSWWCAAVSTASPCRKAGFLPTRPATACMAG